MRRIALPLYVSESLAYRLWGPYNGKYFLIFVEVGNLQMELARPAVVYSYFLIFVEVGNLQMELARPTIFLFSYIPYAHAS